MTRTPEEKQKIREEFKTWYESSGVTRLGVTLNPEMNPIPEDIMEAILNIERAIREGRVTRVYELGDKPEIPDNIQDIIYSTKFDNE